MLEPFENILFTSSGDKFESDSKETSAPMFRKKFNIAQKKEAKLFVCGLGYGYFYINGQKVTDDLFTAPVSNYEKTLWYNVYDVTDMLSEGENIVAVICGNGWFNENFNSSWSFNKAPWRNSPRFALKLVIDGVSVVESGEGWKWHNSAIIYNQLRSGEWFDSRLYEKDWNKPGYDDSFWKPAVAEEKPAGIFRECVCEGVREFEIYPAVKMKKTGEKRFLFDIGQNISGYIRLAVTGNKDAELVIKYGEDITEENEINYNGALVHYPETEYETDKFICNGEYFEWSPMFTYHGFRYIEITGLETMSSDMVSGVFVHQAVEERGFLKCSDEFINKLFYMGRMATLSNLCYMPTDCPSREKLGWLNDAQASCDHFLTNFKTEALLEKWMQDIYDAMDENGSVPGIVPTWGWGFACSGAVCDGALYEIPYQIWLHTGNAEPLKNSLPYFKRNLKFLESKEENDGLSEFGLGDHAAPNFSRTTPKKLVNAVLTARFCDIASLSARLCKENDEWFVFRKQKIAEAAVQKYIRADKQCSAEDQTSVAMMICSGFYDDISQLKMQLGRLVGENMYHHNCGMVGLRYLYKALTLCGLQEYAYEVIISKGFPSYSMWMDSDGTTMHELWKGNPGKKKEFLIGSMNHHMYSDVCSWLVKNILGISPSEKYPGFEKTEINPYFFKKLDWAEGSCKTVNGEIKVSWKRAQEKIILTVKADEKMNVYFAGQKITGEKTFETEVK